MEFLSRHKRAFVVIVSICCAITIILTINYKFRPTILDNVLSYALTPIMTVTTNTGNWFADKKAFFTDNYSYKDENDKLNERVLELESENKRLKLVEDDYKKLSELMVLDEKYPEIEKFGALVVGKDVNNWFSTFIINKGSKDGVKKNTVVLTSGGLVGKVAKVSDKSAEVVTIIDNNSSVSVKCLRTDDIGILKGNISLTKSGLCRMDFKIDAQIVEGDEIITSQTSDIYPAGISIGIVKEVKIDEKGLSKYAIIKPYVDFSNIETVLVSAKSYSHVEEISLEEKK